MHDEIYYLLIIVWASCSLVKFLEIDVFVEKYVRNLIE